MRATDRAFTARRAALDVELRHAQETYQSASAERVALERQPDGSAEARAALIDQARGREGADERLAEAEARYEEHSLRHDLAAQRADSAYSAVQQVEREIEALIAAGWAEFAAAAETKTQAAVEAFAAIEPTYREAEAAWKAAAAAWAPLARVRQIHPVQRYPLPDLFGAMKAGAAPRPPQVTAVPEDGADVIEALA